MDKVAEKRELTMKALAESPPRYLLGEPLEFLFADHFRQRVLCKVLDEMAEEAHRDSELAGLVLQFLEGDFGIHVLDEEEDLFPLLRRRAVADDNITNVLGELSNEHAADKQDGETICAALREGEARDPYWRELFKRFAANERHHLIVENAIVLPLARARLTPGDLASLGRRMAARRGIAYPEDAAC